MGQLTCLSEPITCNEMDGITKRGLWGLQGTAHILWCNSDEVNSIHTSNQSDEQRKPPIAGELNRLPFLCYTQVLEKFGSYQLFHLAGSHLHKVLVKYVSKLRRTELCPCYTET